MPPEQRERIYRVSIFSQARKENIGQKRPPDEWAFF